MDNTTMSNILKESQFDEHNNEETIPNQPKHTLNNVRCSFEIVRLIRHLLGGRDGELTTIGQFAFQYFITQQNNTSLAESVRRFMLNKMNVANTFSTTMISFGGVPKFTNGQGMYWGARTINYQTSPERFLDADIRILERQIREYNRVINRANNQTITNILRDQISNNERLIQELRTLI